MSHRPAARLRPAFTLIELLLAIAMAALVSLSLFAALRIAFKARDSAQAGVEPGRTGSLAMEALSADLEAALPPSGILAGAFTGSTSPDDRGRDDADLLFYAPVAGPHHEVGDGDTKKVELTVIVPPGTDEHVLVRRITSNLLSQTDIDPDDEVICRGVGAFTARYYDGRDWQESWDSTTVGDVLPVAIELTLELDRPAPGGSSQTIRFTRVVQLPCGVSVDSTTSSGDASTSSGAGGN